MSALRFLDDFAAGDGAKDLAAWKDDDFPFARFKVDGAIDNGPLLELDNLLPLKGGILADGDRFEFAGGKEGFLGEDCEGVEKGGTGRLERAENCCLVLDGGAGEIRFADDIEGADFSVLGDETADEMEIVD